MSDMVHFGNVTFLSKHLEALLSQNITVEHLISVVRLLDSLMAAENGI
jgi:hypothetical protein